MLCTHLYPFTTKAAHHRNLHPPHDGKVGAKHTTLLLVTHLANSLQVDVGSAGFSGVRTEILIPPTLNNPPGVVSVLFDLTLDAPYAGTFADIGVTLFGHALNPGGPGSFGNQVQFADTVSFAGLAAGTYLNQAITLDNSVGSYRPGESFNAIFGPIDPNDLTVASAFQFFISKNAGVSARIYIDNVRLVVPEPASLALIGLAGLAMVAVRRQKR